MWLAHHDPGHYDRCAVIGGTHVCRRCVVLYPLAVVFAVIQVVGAIPDSRGVWIMWLAPVPVVVEWTCEHLGGLRYSPVRQGVPSAIAAVSLGVALGRHARHPFELTAAAPVVTYALVCLVAWLIAHRGSGDDSADWESDFAEAEAERLARLRAAFDGSAQPASDTKSMSSSTAPTSDGFRSL